MRGLRLGFVTLGMGVVACGGRAHVGDDSSSPEAETGGRATDTGGGGWGTTGGAPTSGGASTGGRSAAGGGGASSGGRAAGGVSSGGDSSGGGSSGGGSSGGDSSGGEGGVREGSGGQPPDVAPDRIGHVEQSCGAYMWSLDGETFLTCRPGDEHEHHPDCVIVDCTAQGDTESICVFSNHCLCSEGFVCDDGSQMAGECYPRVSCVPE